MTDEQLDRLIEIGCRCRAWMQECRCSEVVELAEEVRVLRAEKAALLRFEKHVKQSMAYMRSRANQAPTEFAWVDPAAKVAIEEFLVFLDNDVAHLERARTGATPEGR